MRYGLLGELEVWDGADLVNVRRGIPRALLIALLLRTGEAVHVDVLIDEVWGDDLPAKPVNALQTQMGYLRKVFDATSSGRGVIETRSGGYALRADRADVDVFRAEQLVLAGAAACAEGEPEVVKGGVVQLEEALALWRGAPLADVADAPAVRGHVARLEELFLRAHEARAEGLLTLGRHDDVIAGHRALVGRHPLRERLHGQLMLALYRAGRQAEALRAYEEVRRVLVEELGIDPGAELRDLERRILAQDADLDWVHGAPTAVAAATSPDAPDGSPGRRKLGSSSLVGRDTELERLVEVLEDAAGGHGGLVLVEGEPGIGKSRLLDELCDLTTRRGATILLGRCLELGAAPALWPWTQVLRQLVSCRGEQTVREATTGRERELKQLLPDLLGPDDEALVPTRPESRFRRYEALGAVLARFADPLLVVALDDVHVADVETQEALAFLADALAGTRVVLVASFRPAEVGRDGPLAELLARSARRPHVRLGLGRLCEGDVGRLIAASTGREVDPAVVDAVHRRTEGNPFFTVELARLLDGDGALEDVTAALGHAAVPATVHDVLRRRLARLTPPAQHLLIAGAVMGREFDLDVAGAVAGLEEDDRLEAADEAIAVRLLEAVGGRRLRFSHVLVADAIVDDVPPLRRARLHRDVAAALARLHPHDARRYAELAHHVTRAAPVVDAGWTLPLLDLAATHAATALDFEESGRLHLERLEVARAYPPGSRERRRAELEALVDLSVLCTWTKGYQDPQVEELCREALLRVDDDTDELTLSSLLYARCAFHMLHCDFGAALAVADELHGLGERHPGGLASVSAAVARGIVALHRGQLAVAGAELAMGEREGRRFSEVEHAQVTFSVPPVTAGSFLSVVMALEGRTDDAVRHAEHVMAVARATGHRFSESFAAMFRAITAATSGDWEATAEWAQVAHRSASRPAFRHTKLLARSIGACAEAILTPDPPALARADQAVAELDRLEAWALRHFLLGLLAQAHLNAGDPAQALVELDAAVDFASRRDERFWLAEVHRLRAEALAAQGDPAAARDDARRAVEVAAEQGNVLLAGRAEATVAALTA